MKRVVTALFVGLVAVTAAACGKKPGSACKPPESTCFDKKTALACQGDKFVAIACNGPLGCNKFQDHANCDDTIAAENDLCMGTGEDEYACTPDKKRALVCKGGKFTRYLECRGKGGCSMLGQQISCDTSVANLGDPCKNQGATSCTADQKQMVICRDGKFETYRYCRGAHGCFFQEESPACDETLSLEGDPCGMPGRIVCSVDGQTELRCEGSRYGTSRKCKKGCTVANTPGRTVVCQ
mgnify:CR=1 FL=1